MFTERAYAEINAATGRVFSAITFRTIVPDLA